MPNIFDSYAQNENKLTQALFSTLDSDKDLLGSFIKDICKVRLVPKDLSISVQNYPSARASNDEKIKSPSLPDAWIYDSKGFAMVFESKITDSLKQGQLAQHQRTAEIRGFEKPRLYTITALSNAGDFDGWKQITWVSIYTWLRQAQAKHPLAKHTADYFEILESRMHSKKSSQKFKITTFTGFDPYYDKIYNQDLAKNTIRKAMEKLLASSCLIEQLDMNPQNSRRKNLKTQKGKSVWDYLSLSDESIKDPLNALHLTLGINDKNIEAYITIPDKIIGYQKKKIKNRGKGLNEEDGKANFIEICEKILEKMKPILKENSDANPIIRGLQRHSVPRPVETLDAEIVADLRTAFENDANIKKQTQWLEVIYDVFCNKKSNYQVQIGINFSYKKCKQMQTPDATDLIIASWLACKPLINACK